MKRLPPVLMRLSCSISPSLDAHYSALLAKSSSYSHSITLCFTSSASLAGCNRICVNSGKHSPCLMIKDTTSDWPIHIAFLIDSIGRQTELRWYFNYQALKTLSLFGANSDEPVLYVQDSAGIWKVRNLCKILVTLEATFKSGTKANIYWEENASMTG